MTRKKGTDTPRKTITSGEEAARAKTKRPRCAYFTGDSRLLVSTCSWRGRRFRITTFPFRPRFRFLVFEERVRTRMFSKPPIWTRGNQVTERMSGFYRSSHAVKYVRSTPANFPPSRIRLCDMGRGATSSLCRGRRAFVTY